MQVSILSKVDLVYTGKSMLYCMHRWAMEFAENYIKEAFVIFSVGSTCG